VTAPLSRRALLGVPLLAAGAAVVAAADGATAWFGGGAAVADGVQRAPVPPPRLRFVSRPDLAPPGVSVSRIPTFARVAGVEQPPYIFVAFHAAGPRVLPGGAQGGLAIIDLNGHYVWFRPRVSTSQALFNFRSQMFRRDLVLTWFEGKLGPGYGAGGEYPLMDSTYTVRHRVTAQGYPSDLHEFTLTPDGTALLTAYEETARLVIGHAQEVDVVSNHLVFDWPSYPSVRESESYIKVPDYFHINSVDLWPGPHRELLASARNCCAVYLVERSTKVKWRLHGRKSDFRLGPGAAFWYQHDARALADGSGISLFDDASQQPPHLSPEKRSWGKVINLDERTMRATLRHEYSHTTAAIDAASQGNMQLLPNGAHVIGFGTSPYVAEYARPAGGGEPEQILDARFPTGVQSYRAFMGDWIGEPPLSELALVVRRRPGRGAFIAYVSWNGATEVDSWHFSAGSTHSSLVTVRRVPRAGFETSIRFTSDGAMAFQASAHDREGKLLGRSRIVSA
jgi:Arylsulfotransferase (ASST)